jgi:recombination protein RecA
VASSAPASNISYAGEWNFTQVAGRYVEISGGRASATLTLTFHLVVDAQRRHEPVGWATSTQSSFYPPDVAELGVDLATLVVVRVPQADAIAPAGEKLLRSGGFGLVVLDLGTADIPMPLQSRFTGLAHHHHAALVCITKKQTNAFSLGSLVSLRVHAERKKLRDGKFPCALRVLKDKRRGPSWSYEQLHKGPPGLC